MSNRDPNLNRDNIWVRDQRDFAIRVEERDLHLFRDKGLRVEEGTRALLLEDGKLVETLRPGFIDMKSHKGGLLWRLFSTPEKLVVILTDDADAILDVQFDRLVTSDNRDVAIAVELVFAIDQPAIFFKNFMRSRRRIFHDDLERAYSRLIEDALMEFVRGKSMDDLGRTRDLKSDVAVSLDTHMNARLKADGMKLVDVLSVRWTAANLDRLKKDREHRTEIDDMLQQIRHAREDEGVREKLQEADIEALTGKLRRAREQAQVLDDDEFEKLRQEFSNRFRKLKLEVEAEAEEVPWRKKRLDQIQDWRRYIQQFEVTEAGETFDSEKVMRKLQLDNEKDKLFTREEMEELLVELHTRAMDRKDKIRARMTLSTKLEIKEQMELELLAIERKFTVGSAELSRQYDMVKLQYDRRWPIEKQKLQHEVDLEVLEVEKGHIEHRRRLLQEKEAADGKRQIALENEEAELTKRLHSAKTEIEIETLKEQLEQVKDKHAMELLDIMDRQDERKRELDRLDREENLRIDRENRVKNLVADMDAERVRLDLRLQEERIRFDQEMARAAAERKFTLDKNAQLGEMPIEKIFALTREDAGDVIRRLKQDEYFKNMTPEQIKAAQLQDLPPHAAKVLEGEMEKMQMGKLMDTEKAHAADIRGLLERIQREDRERWDRERDDAARDKKDFQDAMFRSRDTGERNIAEIVRASKSDAGGAPVIVVPGQGGGTVFQPGQGGQTPAGGGTDAVDIRCPNCGVKITRKVNFCPECGKEMGGR